MNLAKRKPGKGFIRLLIATIVSFVIFLASFLLVGAFIGLSHNHQIKDFGALMQYHVDGLKGLFTFKLNDASNIIYFNLSCLLYIGIVLWVAFLIVGIVQAVKRKRATIVYGLVATFLSLFVFMFTATGIPQYWLIVNTRAPYDNNPALLLFTLFTIVFSLIYIVLAFVLYFVCVVDTYRNSQIEEPVKEELPKQEEKKIVIEEPKKEEKPVVQSAPILEEPKEEQPYEYNEEKEDTLSKKDLAQLIRDIVRDEVSRQSANNPYPQGPLVVQYFGTAPISQTAPQNEIKKEEIKEEPLPKENNKQEPVAEVKPSDEVKVHDNIVPEEDKAPEYIIVPEEEKVEEPAPVKEENPVVEEAQAEKNKIIRIPFQTRMINADEEMKRNYNELKNEILSYGVNDRVSNSGDAFRLHRKTYVKITIAGLSLKLYFALNPDDYKDSPIPVQNAGHKGIYADIPLVFKVKSGLSMRRAKELIQTVMEKDGFEQGVIGDTDWVEELKKEPVSDDDSQED